MRERRNTREANLKFFYMIGVQWIVRSLLTVKKLRNIRATEENSLLNKQVLRIVLSR